MRLEDVKAGAVANLDVLAVLVAALTSVLSNYPGYAYFDTFMQLEFAKAIAVGTGVVIDHHPLAMSVLMAGLMKFTDPIGGVFVLHQILFWAGLFLIVRRVGPGRPITRFFLILLIGFFPSVYAANSAVLKDIGLTASLVFCVGLLSWYPAVRQGTLHVIWWLVFAPSVVYALLVRVNGMPAVPALFILLCLTTRYRLVPLASLVKRFGAFLLFVTLVAISNFFATYYIFNAQPGYVVQQVYLYDLAGISLNEETNLIPIDFFRSPNANPLEMLKRSYSPLSCMFLFNALHAENLENGATGLVVDEAQLQYVLRQTTFKPGVDLLASLWRRAIREHPKSFLKHRLSVIRAFLHLPPNPVCFPMLDDTTGNDLGYKAATNAVRSALLAVIEPLSQSFIFRGWFYALISIAGTALSFIQLRSTAKVSEVIDHREWIAFAVFLSGTMYLISSAVVVISCDFRYHHWTILSCLIGYTTLGLRYLDRNCSSQTVDSSTARI